MTATLLHALHNTHCIANKTINLMSAITVVRFHSEHDDSSRSSLSQHVVGISTHSVNNSNKEEEERGLSRM
jgi:hypothetical protein